MTVYVFHEYYDNDSFGEMVTKVYSNKEKALNALKKSAENFFRMPFDKIQEQVPEWDIVTPENIEIELNGGAYHWVVEECELYS